MVQATSIFTVILAATAATVVSAAPKDAEIKPILARQNEHVARQNPFNGQICKQDTDCPSDYPYCACSFVIYGTTVGTPETDVYQCSNNKCADGCIPNCNSCLC